MYNNKNWTSQPTKSLLPGNDFKHNVKLKLTATTIGILLT